MDDSWMGLEFGGACVCGDQDRDVGRQGCWLGKGRLGERSWGSEGRGGWRWGAGFDPYLAGVLALFLPRTQHVVAEDTRVEDLTILGAQDVDLRTLQAPVVLHCKGRKGRPVSPGSLVLRPGVLGAGDSGPASSLRPKDLGYPASPLNSEV